MTDIIPYGLIFNSYNASQGTYNSATGIWNVGTILNGASAVLKLFVTPTACVAGKNVTNTATITAQNEYNSNTSHSASVTVHVGSGSIIVPQHKSTTSLSQQNINSSTVPMLPTGAPLMPLLLGALMMVAGFANNARKKIK